MDCSNVNLKRGSTGSTVKELQNLLKNKHYYTGRLDGSYGQYTEQAVRNYQKQNGLIVDGVFGPVTCRKIHGITTTNNTTTSTTNTTTTTTTPPSGGYTIFTNTKLCEQAKPDCLGQISSYHCGPHAIRQALRRLGITKYSEKTIGGYAGTTSAGTSHLGIETAIATIAQLEGISLKVKWVNFSDLGSTMKERFRRYGDLMTDEDTAVLHHELYKGLYGHYSILKQSNINSLIAIVANSLGSRIGSGFAGYMESRPFTTQVSYFNGISQRSICIITKA